MTSTMHLRCKYCDATQPVTRADEADEDLRTQGIRRAFRAEHLASCGEGAVSLVTSDPALPPVDQEAWNTYLAAATPPAGVMAGADGTFTRLIERDGQPYAAYVCEDCWQPIPRYIDFPAGLVSPETDGPAAPVEKLRPTTVETESPGRAGALEHLRKVVCLPCYRAAFARVYPGAPLPDLSDAIMGDGAPIDAAADQLLPEPLGHVALFAPARPGLEVR